MAKFQKGKSGNPSGKKSGTPNKRTQLIKFLEPHAEKLISKAVDLALEGDINALRLCIERLIPKATAQQVQIDLQEFDIECSNNLSNVGKKIIAAITTGVISPEDGKQLMCILDSQRKLIEHVDMSRKLEEIIESQTLGF